MTIETDPSPIPLIPLKKRDFNNMDTDGSDTSSNIDVIGKSNDKDSPPASPVSSTIPSAVSRASSGFMITDILSGSGPPASTDEFRARISAAAAAAAAAARLGNVPDLLAAAAAANHHHQQQQSHLLQQQQKHFQQQLHGSQDPNSGDDLSEGTESVTGGAGKQIDLTIILNEIRSLLTALKTRISSEEASNYILI